MCIFRREITIYKNDNVITFDVDTIFFEGNT